MALSLTTQWTLVASGLMAHADQVMSGEECERLMALVDEEVDGDDYAQWIGLMSEPERLAAMLEELSSPPPATHRQILEEAWLMAVVDGERADVEIETLQRVAARLGVDPMQLDFWREAWSAAQHAYAETAAATLSYVLGGGAPVSPSDAGVIENLVHELPTTHEHRTQLVAVGLAPHDHDAVERQLRATARPQRRDLVRRLATAVGNATREAEARERWRALGRGLGLTDEELDRFADG
jgi:uncharacterized tellurite resistance protein B-like protein